MTCIAFDGKTLAADRRTAWGSMIGETTKIRRIGDLLVGAAGNACVAEEMFEWVRLGRDPKFYPEMQRNKEDWVPLMVVEPNGHLLVYERTPYASVHEQRYMAIGSGREFAMAAMYLGKTAREAVEVACALDINCGNGVDVLELE